MRYQVICEYDLLQLIDDDGNGHDAMPLGPGQDVIAAGKRKIDEWKREYSTIDAAAAKRELTNYVNGY
jgi:hypothetical protein